MFQAEETASAKVQRLLELKEVTLWKGNGTGALGTPTTEGAVEPSTLNAYL